MERINKKNGDIIDGKVYCRTYDFNRDSIKELVGKILNWKTNYREKYIPQIIDVLSIKIKKTNKYEK